MKTWFKALIILLLFPSLACGQGTMKFENFTITTTVNGTDRIVLNRPLGGGLYGNRLITFTNFSAGLGGGGLSTRTGIPREIWVDAGAMVPQTNAPAAPGTYTPSGSDNMTKDVLDFDDTTAEGAHFFLSFPDEWDRGTIKVKFYWTTAASSGGVAWQIAAGAASDGDNFGAIVGTGVTVTDTATGANKMHITSASSALTVGGTPALHDGILFAVARAPSNGSDTMTGDARLLGVKIQYIESTTEPTAW